ncbi:MULTISPECIES: hypothetical protein [unclassified Pantoea]|nr:MULTISPECIES: hypothetical protein [unclassified Pantoea]GME31018.1 hypothetical protein ACJ3_07220 [Pantoea sp. QMID3]GME31263.1 hypothetical protein ACJ1_07170 [Pantoea sp. QMID1]GME51302.1 hypothetical protein ACJ4_07220 [Pantoea sp. QMID4]GME52515.1 hypothetical protein ACJ2_07210 [Pantoea sp. QMID2]
MSEFKRYDLSQNGIYCVEEDEDFAINEDYVTLKAQGKTLVCLLGS